VTVTTLGDIFRAIVLLGGVLLVLSTGC